jgi:bacterioferritin
MIMSGFLDRIFGQPSSPSLPVHGSSSHEKVMAGAVKVHDRAPPDFQHTTPMHPEKSHSYDVIQGNFFRPNSKLRMLDKILATQLVFMLRYRRHHCSATSLGSPWIAEQLIRNSNQALRHSDKITRRIIQLGGLPDYSPQYMDRRSQITYDDSLDMNLILESDLLAERSAMRFYSQMSLLLRSNDDITRKIIEEIQSDACNHVNELKSWIIKN